MRNLRIGAAWGKQPRNFEPPGPSADSLNVYGRARALAEKFWNACAREARISEEFQAIAAANLRTLESLPRTGAFAA